LPNQEQPSPRCSQPQVVSLPQSSPRAFSPVLLVPGSARCELKMWALLRKTPPRSFRTFFEELWYVSCGEWLDGLHDFELRTAGCDRLQCPSICLSHRILILAQVVDPGYSPGQRRKSRLDGRVFQLKDFRGLWYS
jgi:hypothetical protein